MIELPEAIVLSEQITKTLKEKTITRVVPAQNAHKFAWYAGDPGDYPEILEGLSIHKVRNVGGMVEADLERAFMLFSEGVLLRFHESENTLPKKHQLLAEFDDGTFLTAGIQMYGGICCFREGEYENSYYSMSREKPTPYQDAFSHEYFYGLMKGISAKMSTKAFLATEQRIPGLGNGVLQDILFNAGIHPKRKINTLTDDEIYMLYAGIRETLSEMANGGGRDTEKDLYGNNGSYKTRMSRNTMGQPCEKCGNTIVKQAYMGGAVYFCPGCQPI